MSQEIHYFNSEFDFTSEIFFNEGIEVGKVREKNLIQVPTRYKIPSFLLSERFGVFYNVKH